MFRINRTARGFTQDDSFLESVLDVEAREVLLQM
jgi:hypothetical protein